MSSTERVSIEIGAIDNASKVLAGVGSSLQSVAKTALGVFAGGIMGKGLDMISGAIGGVKDAMIGGNAEFERYQTQFGVLLKSTDKAKERLAMLAEFGAKTPFELPELVKADKVLTAFGLHSDTTAQKFGVSGEQILTTIGDIAAGTGTSFEDLSLTFGKFASGATGEAISRFQELGIATREEMAGWGLEFSKSGQLLTPVAEAFTVLEKHVRGKFGGMMDAQSQTFEGMVSNFQDWLGQTGRILGAPIFEALKTQLADVLTFLSGDAVKSAITGFAQGIAGGITQVIGFLQTLAPYIPLIVNGFMEFGGAVQTAFATASSALAPFVATVTTSLVALIPTVTSIGTSVQSIFGSLIPIALTQGAGAWTLISTTIQTVITSAIAILQTWLPVVQTVLAGIAAFLTAHGAEIQLLVSTAWNAVTTIIQTAINTVTAVINALAPVVLAIFGQISAFLDAHGSAILGFLTTSWNSISDIVGKVAAIIQTVVTRIFGGVATFIDTHGATIQRVLTAAWNVISTIISTTLDIIQGVVTTVLAVLNGDWATAWTAIEGITRTVNAAIGTILNTGMEFLKSVISLGVAAISLAWDTAWTGIKNLLDTIWEAIKTAINDAIEAAKTAIANGVEAFLDKFRDLRDKMSVIGQQLLEGMVQGIRDKVGWLVEEGVRAANAVLSAIKNTLGIKSPSVEGEKTSGYLIAGLVNGIRDNAGDWVNAGVDAANNVVEHIRMAIAPLPQMMADTIGLSTRWFAETFEDQILTAAESFVELAQTGDTSSLLFAQSFEAIKNKISELIPAFGGGQSAMQAMHAAMASGQFDVQAYWAAYDKLLHEIKTTMGITQQVVSTATQNISTTATANANTTRDNVNRAFDNILVVAGVAINTLTGEVLNSSVSMSGAMNALANSVVSTTQTMQTQASSAAQSIAASMIAAGQVINTTQQQLAGFVQNGGVGGIIGGTYTPSQAFQDSFRNQAPIVAPAPARPSSVAKDPQPIVNNNTVTLNVTAPAGSDQSVFTNAFSNALARAGMQLGAG